VARRSGVAHAQQALIVASNSCASSAGPCEGRSCCAWDCIRCGCMPAAAVWDSVARFRRSRTAAASASKRPPHVKAMAEQLPRRVLDALLRSAAADPPSQGEVWACRLKAPLKVLIVQAADSRDAVDVGVLLQSEGDEDGFELAETRLDRAQLGELLGGDDLEEDCRFFTLALLSNQGQVRAPWRARS
jgi:hypothetical protein